MSIEVELQTRSEFKCELCSSHESLGVFPVPPELGDNADTCVYACEVCRNQIENASEMDANHWRCLNDSVWSSIPAVQVLAWRMLTRLQSEGWPQNLLDMLFLEEDVLNWAKQGEKAASDDSLIVHKDCHGTLLELGDTVTLIKDLNVKGAGFTAKRGTAVRNISLVMDNGEHIEGKVNGQQIVILTKFVKKST